MKRLSIILFILVISVIVSECKKPETSSEVSEIDEFIWEGLSDYYLWEDVAPYISNVTYQNDNKRNELINSFNGDHEALFYNLLYQYGTIDKWSWIVDDYVALEQYFQGISKTMGFEFGLIYKDQYKNDIYGFIKYVMPGSPADDLGLKRGDLFLEINDQQLTVNNYRDLLYLSSYKLSLAEYVNDNLQTNGESVLISEEVYEENPIYLTKVFEDNGVKIGYLVYNSFTSTFDNQLNNVFQDFISEGVSELVLDLRYNGGGSVQSAVYLASMIYGTDTNNVFSRSQYNVALQDYFTQEYGEDFFVNYFASGISQTNGGSLPINSLGLSRVYIICTQNTASASELVINGLKPYMDVYLIGTNTHGKYVGSFTVKDYISQNTVNPNHTWAMQPITFRIENSQGVSDFVNGFTPDYELTENYDNLIALGDETEPLLNVAIHKITGKSINVKRIPKFENIKITDSKDLKPLGKDMHMDITIDKKLQLH